MDTPTTETEPQLTSHLITIDDFDKVDLRVGTVKVADRVLKSDKLIRLDVDFGNFQRQILGAIGRTYEPTALVDKQFIFVVNLPPRKMMGLESNGMILATGAPEALTLISPSAPVPNGCQFG